ncbi:MAG: hypothetical protein L6Q76_30160 [Polyangiaceae bacterium]|nr:hypothetical protein [Polyangiaceae bacterium]
MASGQTHLDGLTLAERWHAWDNAKEFILVKDSTGREASLSRWDVHTMLESATEIAFSSPGTGAAGVPEQVFVRDAAGSGKAFTEGVVQRPREAGQWIAELAGFARGHSTSLERYYSVGPWIVSVGHPDYYAHIYGAVSLDRIASYSASGDTYQAMLRGASSYKDWTGAMMGFLTGAPLQGVPAEAARLTVAMCVSEAVRNFRAWGVNLMLLDLLRGNFVKGGFTNVIMDGLHPMAKGSTYDTGRTGMRGGRKSRETWAHETCITMMWLCHFAGVSITPIERSDLRWRDPVKGEAHVSTLRRRLTEQIVDRIKRLGFAWEL